MADETGAADAGADAGAQHQDAAADPAVERRARDMGWLPQDRYRGAREWVSAEEYVRRGDSMLPLLQQRTRLQERQMAALQTQLSEQGQAMAEVLDRQRRAEKIGYDRAVRELQQRKVQAISDGDHGAVNAIDREITELGAPPPPPAVPQQNGNGAAPLNGGDQAVVNEWIAREPWFRTDRVANAAAIAMMDDVRSEMPNAPLDEMLEEVADRVKTRLGIGARRAPARAADREDDPAEADPPAPTPRTRAASVASSREPAPRPRVQPRSFEAMPRAVQAQFDRELRALQGKGQPLTKAEFAGYYWEQFPDEGAA